MVKRQSRSSGWFRERAVPLRMHVCPSVGNMPEAHRHDWHELVFIRSGTGLHEIDGASYPIEAGDVYLVRPQSHHRFHRVAELDVVNLLYHPERMALPSVDIRSVAGYLALFELEPSLRLANGFSQKLTLDAEQLGQALRLCEACEDELEAGRPGAGYLATARFMELIVFLARCYAEETHVGARDLARVGPLLDELDRRCDEAWTLNAMVAETGMSKSTLSRAVRRATGQTPMAYLNELRLRRSLDLLRGDDDITSIALQLGFADASYFGKQFRRAFGCTPSEWRRSGVTLPQWR